MTNSSTRLTDTQLVLLSAAARRNDLLILIPEHLKGGAARNIVSRLLSLRLIEEVTVSRNEPAWRTDDEGQAVGLKLTRAGLAAIGIETDDDTGIAAGAVPPESEPASSSPVAPTAESQAPPSSNPKAGSKQALILSLLQRESGATLDDLTESTGWLPHTARAALSGLRRKGYAIEKSKRENGATVYRIGDNEEHVSTGISIAERAEA